MGKANEKQVGGSHYRSPIQHWDYVLANDIPYMEAQIIKYVSRHAKKNGVQDLEKAQHFLEKLIEVEKKKLDKCPTLQPGEHRMLPHLDCDDPHCAFKSEWGKV